MKNLKLFVFALISFMFIGLVNVNAEEYVAKIGDKEYDLQSFLVALTQTKENDEVVILDNIDLTSYFPSVAENKNPNYVPLADNVTVDLNGKSITTNNHSITFVGNDITIKNGKFIVKGYGTANEGSYALFLGRISQASSNYTLEDLVLEGGLNVKNATNVVLKNVTATGTNYYAVWAELNADVTIKSGSFSSKSGTILNSNPDTNGIIIVEGGTFNDFIPGYYYAADSNTTIKLTKDLNLNGVMDLAGNMTIDLNGHDIVQKLAGENVFIIQGGNINITGNGKIISHSSATNAIRILGSGNRSDREYTVVTIGKDVTVESNGYGAYISTVDGYKAYGVQVNIYGTLKGGYNGFFVSGNIQDVEEEGNFTNFPVVNIHDGANVQGIYAGGYAIWNIGAANIKDEEYGLGIKAGNFVIDGANITAIGEKEEPVENNSGISHSGSAIQLETNAKYADHIDVTLRNVTVSSTNGYAILEYLGQSEILNLDIISGTFKSANNLDIIKVSEDFDKTGFIKGGTYSADVNKEYIATGLVSKKVGNMYTVGKENSVSIGKVTAGTVEIDKTKAVVGETVTITLKPNAGYEVSTIKVLDADNKEVTVTDNTFVMPNSSVKIEVVYVKTTIITELPVVDTKEEVKEATVAVKEETKVEEVLKESLDKNEELAKIAEKESVKVELSINEIKVNEKSEEAIKEVAGKATIATYFDININVKKVSDGSVLGTLSNLTKEIELMIVLPENLKNTDSKVNRKYFVIREHTEDGKTEVEKIPATLSEDGNYLVFKTDKFSTYALAYEDRTGVPSVPQTGDNVALYITLGFISIAAIGVSLNSLKRRTSR